MKKSILKKIAQFGFTCERIETNLYRGLFGGNCNHVIVLKNSDGKMLSFNGTKPYVPAGREDAFLFLLENGGWKNETWI